MSFPARRKGGGALGAPTPDKRVGAHTCDPVSHVPHSVEHKGVSQVILHMLLSGFFNTCSFCFCQPALHGDIKLWLADSQAQVSAYR